MAKASIRPYQGQLSLPFELGENLSAGDPIYVYNDSGTAKIAKCMSNTANQSAHGKGYYNQGCMVNTAKFVVVYRDLNNSNRGYIRAGDINGDNSITWGTAVLFWASTTYYIDVCSHATDAFCIVYRGVSSYTELRAGTINTGTLAIILGTAVSIGTGICYYNQICSPATGKVCAVWKDAGISNYLVGRAATITGSTIGIPGATQTLDAVSPSYIGLCSPATDKIVATYYYNAKGYAVAATLVGTAFNAPGIHSEFNAAAVYSTYVKSPNTNKVAVVYRNAFDGYKPYIRCATLSGLIFTWGTAVKVSNESSYYQALGVLATDELVLMYTKDIAPYKGLTIKASISGTAISLATAECFLDDRGYYIDCFGVNATKYGILWYDTVGANAYTLIVDGPLNTIPNCLGILEETGVTGESKKGAMLNSITKALSGLTIGSAYYIQSDGSITLTQSPYPIALAYKSNEAFISKTILG